MLALLAAQADAKTVDLGDGFVRVVTPAYSVELPKDWKLSAETPWGARKATGPTAKGEMGTMTAGPTLASWESLVRTSLGFILREEKGKPTPYEVSRTEQGYEACSFSVLNASGFAARRYVLLRAPSGRVLALNVKIGDPREEKRLSGAFARMVRTAKLVEPR